jgi:hypothetical protein
MTSIQEFIGKSKRVGEGLKAQINQIISGKVYTIIIIILVALASFGLGRLSKIEENRPPVRLIDNSRAMPATANNAVQHPMLNTEAGKYVSSKSGAKYHLPWCSGAQRIKEENKIWFDSKETAERAGYSPAVNCKGI